MQAFGPFLSVRVEIYAVHVWSLYVVYKCLCVYSYFSSSTEDCAVFICYPCSFGQDSGRVFLEGGEDVTTMGSVTVFFIHSWFFYFYVGFPLFPSASDAMLIFVTSLTVHTFYGYTVQTIALHRLHCLHCLHCLHWLSLVVTTTLLLATSLFSLTP